MAPRDADHNDLKFAPDGARTTIASGLFCINSLLLVRKMAPLEELAQFSGATM